MPHFITLRLQVATVRIQSGRCYCHHQGNPGILKYSGGILSDWQLIGRQKICVTDDLVHWEVLAQVNLSEFIAIFQACFAVQQKCGYVLWLITATDGDWAFPPAARKYLAQFHREHRASGATALVGVGATTAVIINLVLRAVALTHGYEPATRFFRSRAEATPWLEEQRALGKKGLLLRK